MRVISAFRDLNRTSRGEVDDFVDVGGADVHLTGRRPPRTSSHRDRDADLGAKRNERAEMCSQRSRSCDSLQTQRIMPLGGVSHSHSHFRQLTILSALPTIQA